MEIREEGGQDREEVPVGRIVKKCDQRGQFALSSKKREINRDI